MVNPNWNKEIKTNFNNAASNYTKYSFIQKYFADEIGHVLKNLNIPDGEWFDFGSGTGILADKLEEIFLGAKVTRIDFSQKMLYQNKKGSKILLHDLNRKLPLSIQNCSLIVSNFCIHWLDNPEANLRDWLEKLKSGGYLIVSFPSENCFPEWRNTCKKK